MILSIETLNIKMNFERYAHLVINVAFTMHLVCCNPFHTSSKKISDTKPRNIHEESISIVKSEFTGIYSNMLCITTK